MHRTWPFDISHHPNLPNMRVTAHWIVELSEKDIILYEDNDYTPTLLLEMHPDEEFFVIHERMKFTTHKPLPCRFADAGIPPSSIVLVTVLAIITATAANNNTCCALFLWFVLLWKKLSLLYTNRQHDIFDIHLTHALSTVFDIH